MTIYTAEKGTITELTRTYEEETLTFGYKDDSWYYTEDPDFPLDSSYLEEMAAVLTEIVA